jgi:hypothetical protein
MKEKHDPTIKEIDKLLEQQTQEKKKKTQERWIDAYV